MLRIAVCLFLAGSLLVGCASHRSDTSSPIVRAGQDLPHHFLIATETGAVEPTDDGTCHNPLVDPRDGTKLTLMRSANGLGDYAVTEGRYGVQAGEYLRVRCATGVPVGIVRR